MQACLLVQSILNSYQPEKDMRIITLYIYFDDGVYDLYYLL